MKRVKAVGRVKGPKKEESREFAASGIPTKMRKKFTLNLAGCCADVQVLAKTIDRKGGIAVVQFASELLQLQLNGPTDTSEEFAARFEDWKWLIEGARKMDQIAEPHDRLMDACEHADCHACGSRFHYEDLNWRNHCTVCAEDAHTETERAAA